MCSALRSLTPLSVLSYVSTATVPNNPNLQVLQTFLPNSPIVGFTILLLAILTIPPIFERLRLPGLVGLLFAGLILGPYGLQIVDDKSEWMDLLSDVGKIYLMFVAGLEIDLKEFRQKKNRSLIFGALTFALPLITGIVIGRGFGFSWNASVLIGSLLASHTLLGYPIVQRFGTVTNETVVITIGATIFTDISALLVLAVCVSIHSGNFSPASLIIQLALLGGYSLTVLFGFDWAGKEYFRRTGDEEGNQFLFVLLAVFLASILAQAINVDKIVGGFLAGLAVNDVVGNGPVKEKIEFVGGVLFIPFFFVGMGMLLNVSTFVNALPTTLGLTLAIVGGLLLSKFLAALVVKWLYRYNFNELMTMWSLSMPQVAATLAAAVAAYEAIDPMGERLIPVKVLNTVIVLMIVTSLLGPLLTERYAGWLAIPWRSSTQKQDSIWWETQEYSLETPEDAIASAEVIPFKVVVPVYNPLTEQYLIEIAALLARHESGIIVPLSIARAHVHMDEPQLLGALRQSHKLLKRAVSFSQKFQVEAHPTIRIDDDVAEGISRVAREQQASLIVMGWGESPTGIRARLFGSIIDSVFWASHCPVAVMRLLEEPSHIHRILVPVKSVTPQAVRTVNFAQLVAETNEAEVTVLHVCDTYTSAEQIAHFEAELQRAIAQSRFKTVVTVNVAMESNVANAIVAAAHTHDMVILRSARRRTAGGLAVSDVTSQVVDALTCSIVLFGEPHS